MVFSICAAPLSRPGVRSMLVKRFVVLLLSLARGDVLAVVSRLLIDLGEVLITSGIFMERFGISQHACAGARDLASYR